MQSTTRRYFDEYLADQIDECVVENYYDDRERADSDFHGGLSYELSSINDEAERAAIARQFGFWDTAEYFCCEVTSALENYRQELAWYREQAEIEDHYEDMDRKAREEHNEQM